MNTCMHWPTRNDSMQLRPNATFNHLSVNGSINCRPHSVSHDEVELHVNIERQSSKEIIEEKATSYKECLPLLSFWSFDALEEKAGKDNLFMKICLFCKIKK